MTEQKPTPTDDKKTQLLEEICENTRAIRRVTNRILDQLHEYETYKPDYKERDEWNWQDMSDRDDMYS